MQDSKRFWWQGHPASAQALRGFASGGESLKSKVQGRKSGIGGREGISPPWTLVLWRPSEIRTMRSG